MSAERELTLYEKRVDALLQLLPRTNGAARETFLETQLALKAASDQAEYFDRWVEALAEKLVANGVISAEELAAKLVDVRATTAKWDTAKEPTE
jgi:hypothetical protein